MCTGILYAASGIVACVAYMELIVLFWWMFQIKTKTVSQCVEFYYTYKKQVKIGRNGMLIFGDVEAVTDEKNPREDSEIDIKVF